jgi:hypothetical protein
MVKVMIVFRTHLQLGIREVTLASVSKSGPTSSGELMREPMKSGPNMRNWCKTIYNWRRE